MPKKKSQDDLVRKHVWLDRTDCERIEILFGESLGFSSAVRAMLHKMLDGIEAKAAQRAQPLNIKPEDLVL